MSAVILNPISQQLYTDSIYEPQIVQTRTSNSGIIYLDSQDSELELNKTNMLLSSIKVVGEQANTLSRQIRRIRILSTGFHLVTPNVNLRNNTIQFISSLTGSTVYTVVVPEGYYTTPASLMTAIVTALNTVTGSSGLTFSDLVVPSYTSKFTLSSAGGSFQILSTSDAVKNGTQLWALPVMNALATSALVGSMGMYYTRYIDICSQRLNQYVKIPSNSNGRNSNIIYRFFVNDPTTEVYEANIIPSDLSGINYNQTDSLATIDFQLYDQSGQLLYIPTGGGPGGQSGFQWDLQLLVE